MGSYGIPSCITDRSLPTHRISFEWAELFWRTQPCVTSEIQSRDTKTTPDITNLAGTNLDVVLWFNNWQSFASANWKWEEVHFENGRFFNFQGLVTLTLTLDRIIRHIIVQHSSTSIPTHQISSTSGKLFLDGHWRIQRANPAMAPSIWPWPAPHPVNTVRKNAYTPVNWLSRKLVKLVPPDVWF